MARRSPEKRAGGETVRRVGGSACRRGWRHFSRRLSLKWPHRDATILADTFLVRSGQRSRRERRSKKGTEETKRDALPTCASRSSRPRPDHSASPTRRSAEPPTRFCSRPRPHHSASPTRRSADTPTRFSSSPTRRSAEPFPPPPAFFFFLDLRKTRFITAS